MTIETILLSDGVLRLKKRDHRGRVLMTLDFEDGGLRAYRPYEKKAPLCSYKKALRRLNPKSAAQIPNAKKPLLLTYDKHRRD